MVNEVGSNVDKKLDQDICNLWSIDLNNYQPNTTIDVMRSRFVQLQTGVYLNTVSSKVGSRTGAPRSEFAISGRGALSRNHRKPQSGQDTIVSGRNGSDRIYSVIAPMGGAVLTRRHSESWV